MSQGNGRGRRPRHGAWTIIKALRGRAKLDPITLRILRSFERALARELGADQPEDLPMQKQLLVSRIVHKALICSRLESYASSLTSIIRGDDGRIIPALGEHYLAFTNSLRLDLQAIGLERIPRDVGELDLEAIKARYAAADAADPPAPAGGEEGAR